MKEVLCRGRILIVCGIVTASILTSACGGGGGTNSSPSAPNPVPAITSLAPSSTTAGSPAQTLSIDGSNFVSSSTVSFNGVAHATTVVSSTEMTIQLTAGDQATAGTYAVVVTNPTPGGGKSNTVDFTVDNPKPTITSLSPDSAPAGTAAQTLTISGTGFLAASTVTFNGASHAATYVSSTQLTIQLTASDQATAGTYPVVVANPAPGGGSSNTVNFVVNNPALSITSLSPPSAMAGSAAQTLIINGSGFISTSTVTYNGVSHAATYVSSTQLTIQLTAGDQATAGTYPVVVANPAGGGTSNTFNFTVNNPAPAVAALSPSSAVVGANAQTLTINGSGFVSTSTVTYNGISHTATYVSSTQLTILLTTGDQATAGTYAVVVSNPAPGGVASSPVNFTVDNPVPAITTLSPSSAPVGSAAQVLTINGSEFVSTSAVTFNGSLHTATYVSSTQLTILLTAGDQATAGTYAVVATNPTPGGGASSPVNFTVTNPAPTITSLVPSFVIAGSGGQTLTVNGSGFFSTSTVTYNGVSHAATFVSSTQLTVQLTSSDVATAGTYPVVVTNPPPGGGTSNTANFTVYLHFSAPTWQTLGPRSVPNAHSCDNPNETGLLAAGRVQAFAIDLANPSVMYAGGGLGTGNSGPSSDAGVFKSADGGSHWTATDSGLGDTYVDALWMDQSNPSILLASTWLDGIYRTTDGGSSWTNVYPAQTTSLVQVGSSVYAATSNGVAVSADNGATWTLVEATASPVRTLAYGNGAVYAGLDNGNILTEQTLSGPWATVYTAPTNTTAYNVAVEPSNGQEAIVVLNSGGTLQNLVTTNGGSTWNTWTAPPTGGLCGSGGPGKVVAFDTVNPNLIYSGSGGAVYASTDGGTSWTLEHMFEDLNLLQPLPGTTGSIVVGGDQGIYESKDSGSTWTTLNGNLSTNLLTGLAVKGSEVFAPIQDFSPVQSFDGGSTWLQLSSASAPAGEDGVTVINPGNPNYQYAWTPGGGFWYSTDGGQNFTNENTYLPLSEFNFAGTTNSLAVDPTNPSTLYLAGTDGVFGSQDWGASWQLLSWPFKDPSLVVVGPDGTIFVGTPPNGTPSEELNISHDGGATWSTSQLPAGSTGIPETLSVDPANPNIVVLGMSGTPDVPGGGILISTDGGSTFIADNSGLAYRLGTPTASYTFTVQFAPAAYPDVVVAATSDGLYISQAGGPWTDISGSAIPRWFFGIAFDSGSLYVSTYGEGVLSAPLTGILTP